MPFTAFHARFRDLAERETRTLTTLQESPTGLPVGHYAFIELFCDEPDCDCRRVLLSVVDATGRGEAVINFGWENASFYAAWLREADAQMIEELRGPELHSFAPQGPHAKAVLELAKQYVFSDSAFVERVKRHYAMFRDDVQRRPRAPNHVKGAEIGRNDPCPCGSGRKYKKCCLREAGEVGADC